MIGMRPRVVGNLVFFSDDYVTNPAYGAGQVHDSNGNFISYGETLLHEGAHIHQFQTGGLNCVPDALVAQGLAFVGLGDGYGLLMVHRNNA